MKTIIYLIGVGIVLAMIAGCARVQYIKPDGTQVAYTRLLTTSDSIEVNVDGAKAKVTKQEINTAIVEALLKALAAVQGR